MNFRLAKLQSEMGKCVRCAMVVVVFVRRCAGIIYMGGSRRVSCSCGSVRPTREMPEMCLLLIMVGTVFGCIFGVDTCG